MSQLAFLKKKRKRKKSDPDLDWGGGGIVVEYVLEKTAVLVVKTRKTVNWNTRKWPRFLCDKPKRSNRGERLMDSKQIKIFQTSNGTRSLRSRDISCCHGGKL